jgi:putative transposase
MAPPLNQEIAELPTAGLPMVVTGVKFACYPWAAVLVGEKLVNQFGTLSPWIGHQRFVYNAKVSEEKYFRTFGNHSLSLTGAEFPSDQQYSQSKDKELTPYLYNVPSQILRKWRLSVSDGTAKVLQRSWRASGV